MASWSNFLVGTGQLCPNATPIKLDGIWLREKKLFLEWINLNIYIYIYVFIYLYPLGELTNIPPWEKEISSTQECQTGGDMLVSRRVFIIFLYIYLHVYIYILICV